MTFRKQRHLESRKESQTHKVDVIEILCDALDGKMIEGLHYCSLKNFSIC